MATVRRLRSHKGVHIEAEGCVVNIYEKLTDIKGRSVTTIEIIPDKFIGSGNWKVIGSKYIRVVKLKKNY